MAAGILLASADGALRVRVPPMPFMAAQAVIGCMIAQSIPVETLVEIVRDWPLFLAGVGWTVVAAAGLGWLLARWQVFPGDRKGTRLNSSHSCAARMPYSA